MNAKFLVVRADSEGLLDYPLKVCEDFTLEETDSCVVYAINEDGTIGEIVKDVDNYSDEGFALIDMAKDDSDEGDRSKWEILEKVSVKSREDFVKTKQYKEWKEKYFKDDEDIENYESSILGSGSFCADYDEDSPHWYAITEYEGNKLYYPY